MAVQTTYDYNAPISESGSHGIGSDGSDKFAALHELLAQYDFGYPASCDCAATRTTTNSSCRLWAIERAQSDTSAG